MGSEICAIARYDCSGLVAVEGVSHGLVPISPGPTSDCTMESQVFLGAGGTIKIQKRFIDHHEYEVIRDRPKGSLLAVEGCGMDIRHLVYIVWKIVSFTLEKRITDKNDSYEMMN